ncbi:hypothetical protein, partial [Parasutterella excrementihominis]|uniref:hypothetical protein n=1 Tax=Parasutterella excrementihominis TaxID=487175 RepID=UPI003AAC8C7E
NLKGQLHLVLRTKSQLTISFKQKQSQPKSVQVKHQGILNIENNLQDLEKFFLEISRFLLPI